MRLVSRVPAIPSEVVEFAAYVRALDALDARAVPFAVGGAYALKHYTGIVRSTKDVDLFVQRHDLERVLDALREEGFRCEVPFPHWLAKAWSGEQFIDVIFNSGNGLTPVDARWFTHAERDVLLGAPVAICPLEETLWSKAFVMERERFDGADIAHLILACGRRMDWAHLLARFGEFHRVLYAHLVLFGFAFPSERDAVPDWVLRELEARLADEPRDFVGAPLCRGTLLSREQYLVDLERGFRDARLEPHGAMTDDQVAIWTEAIATRR